ncbi:hypothetical protein AX769_21115 (plasmid) [Frondihabitans sp. PAMC 28766]|nr:hypothetical protein AX769_21115 [Frondihabitans sp. PAMC 28766]
MPTAGTAIVLGVILSVAAAGTAQAATTLDGPIDLGTAVPFGVLGASTITNTGPSVIAGDVGVSPGTSITGFPPATLTGTGTLHQTDAVATGAQADTTTAFNAAASLTPTTSGLTQLNGLSLTPGVYSGGALSLSNNGALTLAGTAESVWVFQAASTLKIGSGTRITLTGGASACNVFWEVGSSATLGSAAQFQGTILAKQSITATTRATVVGRLLANNAAVTLDTNTITTPTGCAPVSTSGSAPVTTPSPAITSGTPTAATVGTPYRFTVTSTGTPTPTYTVTSGTLPAGLTLNATTGEITGTPTTAGSTPVTITASNGALPSVSAIYTVTVRAAAVTSPTPTPTPTPPASATVPTSTTSVPGNSSNGSTGTSELAFTGSNPTGPLIGATVLLLAGLALLGTSHRRRPARPRRHRMGV